MEAVVAVLGRGGQFHPALLHEVYMGGTTITGRAHTGINTDQLIEMAEADKDILAAILFGSSARGEVYRDIDIGLVTISGTAHLYQDASAQRG